MKARDLLGSTLRRVSRSFFLTLRVLPRDVRRPIGLAYLFARAADTISDTRLIGRADRLRYLELFRTTFGDGDPGPLGAVREALTAANENAAERELLFHLELAFAQLRTLGPADQSAIRNLILTITEGMVFDLTAFPGEDEGRLVALETRADLDRYTYYVAGCVGEFWTDIHIAHRPSLAGWNREAMALRGVCFGKGLQMTNVLRDLSKDLRIGRCYLPRQDLERLGLRPADLLDPAATMKVRPLLRDLLGVTLEHYQQGWAYTLAVPRREIRMRLACAWPLLIGLKTLALVAQSPNLLDPRVIIKIPRRAVYALMVRSCAVVAFNAGLDRHYSQLRRGVQMLL
jgi:farnesyl-diphosphate farnesyltransferase